MDIISVCLSLCVALSLCGWLCWTGQREPALQVLAAAPQSLRGRLAQRQHHDRQPGVAACHKAWRRSLSQSAWASAAAALLSVALAAWCAAWICQ